MQGFELAYNQRSSMVDDIRKQVENKKDDKEPIQENKIEQKNNTYVNNIFIKSETKYFENNN